MQFPDLFVNNVGNLLRTLTILISALFIREFIKKTSKAVFAEFEGRIDGSSFARINTVRLLLVNIINTVVFLIAILTILSTWGVNVAPILAGLGIVGVGLSFGSQSLVKDLISGFFIILEDQFRVGDTIKFGTYEGTVKKITIRSTVIRDTDGNWCIYPTQKSTLSPVLYPNLVKRMKKRTPKISTPQGRVTLKTNIPYWFTCFVWKYSGMGMSEKARLRLAFLEFYQIVPDVSVVCRSFKISRTTFYKWQDRFDPNNLKSLEDCSRTPKTKRQGILTFEEEQ